VNGTTFFVEILPDRKRIEKFEVGSDQYRPLCTERDKSIMDMIEIASETNPSELAKLYDAGYHK